MSANGSALPLGGDPSNGGDAEILTKIHQALEVVHSSFSLNDDRRQAQAFLEDVKDIPEAPLQGYRLASNKDQPAVVRHYALSLLEHAIRYRWSSYSQEQATALRNWVLELSQAVSRDDPAYLRNKTAQLWVEVAKSCWGAEWMDMDAMLVQLWQVQDSAVHKELVMFVLETLSDEVFAGDDSVVAMREGVLSKACVEIFTPTSVLVEAFPNRQPGPDVRHGHEGWLSRISQFLDYCVHSDAKDNDEVKSCTLKALSVLLSLMPWAIPKAIAAARCVTVMTAGLASPHVEVQKVQSCHVGGSRWLTLTNITRLPWKLSTLFMGGQTSQTMSFRSSWSQCLAGPPSNSARAYLSGRSSTPRTLMMTSIKLSRNSQRYCAASVAMCTALTSCKMLSSLGDYFERKYSKVPADAASAEFLQLLIQVVRSPSLMVSIPVLVTWTRLLGHRSLGHSDLVTPMVAPLLEVCNSRLVRYENLPEDTTDPTYLFLVEDTDTMPERHAFLGNYRRYSCQIVELIVQLKLVEAISHILSSTEYMLQNLYDGQPPFSSEDPFCHQNASEHC